MLSKFVKYTFIVSLMFLFASLFSQMYFANNLAVQGQDMRELYSQKDAFQREISAIELEISELSSMPVVEARALNLGFVKNNLLVSTIKPLTRTAAVSSL